MAGDLIPPPSPAGRPAPDPEQPPPVRAEPEAPAAAGAAGPVGPSPFHARFGFAMGALAGVGVAAAVLLGVLLATGGGGGGERRAATGEESLAAGWSPWRPHTSGTIAGAQEIAREIEGHYKDAKAKKLAGIRGGPIALNTLPASVAIPAAGDAFTIVRGVGIQYTLAGFGKDGRLLGSEPSKARRRLLRREALELSLYSFRYLPEVTMVVALLPPAPKVEQVHPKEKPAKAAEAEPFQPQALFYRPGDLRRQLTTPLARTMAAKPPRIGALDGVEAKRIDRLTLPNLFTHRYIQQQDGSIYLVLDRPS